MTSCCQRDVDDNAFSLQNKKAVLSITTVAAAPCTLHGIHGDMNIILPIQVSCFQCDPSGGLTEFSIGSKSLQIASGTDLRYEDQITIEGLPF